MRASSTMSGKYIVAGEPLLDEALGQVEGLGPRRLLDGGRGGDELVHARPVVGKS